jgi:hypothetical protein
MMMMMRGRIMTARIISPGNRTMLSLLRTTYSELLPARRKLYPVGGGF